jgi:DNA-binding NtrC family response regulator
MADIKGHILLVDDDSIIVESLAEMLRLENYRVTGAANLRAGIAACDRDPPDVVLSDINMPGGDGFELLRVIKQRWRETAVIMITGYGTIESAVEAIKMGAFDYLTKPLNDDEVRLVVERALTQQALVRENHALRRQLDQRFGLGRLVGADYRMQRVFDLIEAVADSSVTVLLQGESGTGKSLVARVLHQHSPRRDKPFVEVACGAIPETLLESELFGHARGAFTGAVAEKAGKFKAAHGGTLFLDEISTASPALQVKLLRVLQERQFEPVGSNKTETVDVRVVLATNQDLEEEVAAGRFRQDLYYRINVVAIMLPSLCERMGDIALLAERFLENFAGKMNKPGIAFSPEAMVCLQHYHWPGNVRELENIVERAVVLTRGRLIGVDDLPPKLVALSQSNPLDVNLSGMPLKKAMEAPERAAIESALRANGWNRQLTAEMLGINRTTLYKKMKRYGLEGEPARSS